MTGAAGVSSRRCERRACHTPERRPKIRDALNALQPKVYALSSRRPAEPVDLTTENILGRVERVVERIQRATFTGAGDKDRVPLLYKNYVGRIAGVITTLPSPQKAAISCGRSRQLTAAPLPLVDTRPPRQPPRPANRCSRCRATTPASPVARRARLGTVDATEAASRSRSQAATSSCALMVAAARRSCWWPPAEGVRRRC